MIKISIPKFIMMVGLVASGKSTKAKKLAEEYNATIFSSDALREEMFHDVNDQTHNQELFVELHKRIKDCLRNGESAIMDATNINYKKRMSFLAELKHIPCQKICIVMATPYEECLRRNSERERNVPEYAIERMYRNFDIPWHYEGWDYIGVDYSESNYGCLGDTAEWIEKVSDYNQDNSHHSLTLGEHCRQTVKFIDSHIHKDLTPMLNAEIRHAAMIHDCGKIFCKTFKNNKGEITEHAHYYSHEHCGSYDSLFYDMPCYNLYVAVLIRWHMQPYFWEKDKNINLHNKYCKLWGAELYRDIMYLHSADKFAH